MPKRPKSARMPQKAEKKSKHEVSREKSIGLIKRAMIDLFVERGYQYCHIEAIARKLGMTKGVVYHYFSSKDAIIAAILNDIETSIFASLERAASDSKGTATQRLLVFLHAQAEYSVQNPKAFSMLVLCSVSFPQDGNVIAEQVRNIFERLESIIHEILADGIAKGEFAAGIDSVNLARSIVGAYAGIVVAWQRSGFEPAVGRALVVEMRAMILARLRLD